MPKRPANFDDVIAGKVDPTKMEDYNKEAMKTYEDKAMDKCPNCGRTFISDRLIVHLRSCNKAHGVKGDEGPGMTKGGAGALGGGASKGGPGAASPKKEPAFI
jgi:uncharacterized C2H2 Zn-finger protein